MEGGSNFTSRAPHNALSTVGAFIGIAEMCQVVLFYGYKVASKAADPMQKLQQHVQQLQQLLETQSFTKQDIEPSKAADLMQKLQQHIQQLLDPQSFIKQDIEPTKAADLMQKVQQDIQQLLDLQSFTKQDIVPSKAANLMQKVQQDIQDLQLLLDLQSFSKQDIEAPGTGCTNSSAWYTKGPTQVAAEIKGWLTLVACNERVDQGQLTSAGKPCQRLQVGVTRTEHLRWRAPRIALSSFSNGWYFWRRMSYVENRQSKLPNDRISDIKGPFFPLREHDLHKQRPRSAAQEVLDKRLTKNCAQQTTSASTSASLGPALMGCLAASKSIIPLFQWIIVGKLQLSSSDVLDTTVEKTYKLGLYILLAMTIVASIGTISLVGSLLRKRAMTTLVCWCLIIVVTVARSWVEDGGAPENFLVIQLPLCISIGLSATATQQTTWNIVRQLRIRIFEHDHQKRCNSLGSKTDSSY